MAVKIRLQRRGRRKQPFYHIVVADARAPRDGRFIEKIGTYNPMTKPATIKLDREKAFDWLMQGAQPTDTARAILRFKGVLYKKHLMRGVKKGALTVEQADAKYKEWIESKEANVAARFEQTAAEKAAFHAMVNGKAKKIEVKAAPVAESKAFNNEPAEEAAPTGPTSATPELDAAVQQIAVDNPDVKETAPVVEETPAAPEPVVEAAPVVEETPAAPEPVVEEATPVAEETPAPVAPVVEEAAPVAAKADDLKKIEGIGPKISEHLNAGGILTFAQLSETAPEKIKEILAAAGPRYAMHDPTTWPSQAKMAAAGQWDELKKWQDESDGGKPIETKETKDGE